MLSKTVLVTNASRGPGIAAAKSLAAAGYRVESVDFRRLPFGLRTRHSRSHHVVTGRDQAAFEEDFLDLVRRVRPDAFLPLDTRFVFITAKNLDRFPAATAVNVPSLDAFMTAYRKSACMAECRKLGIACPLEYSFEKALGVLENDRDAMLVVKPDSDAGAAAGVRFVRDRESFLSAVGECTQQFGRTLIQQYIPGGAEAMKTVLLLFSRDSRLAAAFTTRKIRQWPETGGLTAVSCSTAEESLVNQVLPFFEKWRWRGPAEVELKLDSRDGQHKVIEINPRFPGYLRFPCECGLDIPALAVRLALEGGGGPSGACPTYKMGAGYVNPGLFVRTVASGLRARGISELRRAFADMRGTGRVAMALLDDPLPQFGRVLSGFRHNSEGQQLFKIST